MTKQAIDAGGLLVLPRLQVQNANAISGPLTWGFPSPTAFIGFVHALERRLSSSSLDDSEALQSGLGGVGIICHRFDPQVAQPAGRRTQVFRLTRNPVGKDGAPTALVEEGRAHIEVSLVIAVKDEFAASDGERWAKLAHHVAQGMRLAGGSILPARNGERYTAKWQPLPEDVNGQKEVFSQVRRQLLPGFALVQREDLLAKRLAELRSDQANATAMDALLDLSRLNFEPPAANPDGKSEAEWELRKRPGWLVPLPIGYASISPLYPPGTVVNTRDPLSPFRFVESLYSLGQWLGPHRLDSLQQLLWHSEADTDQGIYRCLNRYSDTPSSALEASH